VINWREQVDHFKTRNRGIAMRNHHRSGNRRAATTWLGLTIAAVMLALPGARPASGQCPADLDADNQVSIGDLLVLLGAWGTGGVPADINGDGDVGLPDLAYLLESWGPCPVAPIPGSTERFDETIAVDVTDAPAAAMGLVVTHLYATGDTVVPGHRLLLVGNADIKAANADYFQETSFGDNLPPTSIEIMLVPAVRYDTFAAMQLLQDDTNTLEDPECAMSTSAIAGGWFALPTVTQRDAVDISGVTGNPGQAGVLIAQITFDPCDASVPPSPPVAGLGVPGYLGTIRLFTSAADGGTLLGVEATVSYPARRADVNEDGTVNVTDLLIVLANWGNRSCTIGDVNGDSSIDVTDLLAILGDWD
jgi:hypothetical protein